MILVLMVAFLVLVIAAVICVTQAQRRISVQYAKRVVGRKVYGGQTQYMPLKVNYAGVMPIIFAWALLVFPVHDRRAWLSSDIADGARRLPRCSNDGLAALYCLYGGDDFLLQLFLGGDAVSATADRGRSEEIRRLHSGRASGKADGGFSRFHDDAADFRGRDFSHDDRDLAADAIASVECAVHHGAVFRRHQSA